MILETRALFLIAVSMMLGLIVDGVTHREDSSSFCPASCDIHHVCSTAFLDETECPVGSTWDPNGGACGCCGACVRYLNETQRCYELDYAPREVQDDGTILIHACDPELFVCSVIASVSPQNTCTKKQDTLSGPCITKSQLIDREYLGAENGLHLTDYFVYPNCEESGVFQTVQKMKRPKLLSRYFCVDKRGNRIFGSAFEEQDESQRMTCECSAAVAELKETHSETHVTLTCDKFGSFRRLQCQDDLCFCVNATSSIITGPFVPKASLEMLPCYDPAELPNGYFGGEKTCGSYRNFMQKILKYYRDRGLQITNLETAECDFDHTYGPIYSTAASTRCIDPDGSPTRFSSLEDGTQAGKMDCLCARDIYITTEANLNLGQLNCEGWGSYKALQTGATKTCVTRDGVRCSSVYTPSQPDCCLPCSNVGKCRPSDLPLCNNADSQDFTDYCFLAALTSDSYLP